jgi:ATP-dependent Lon protease
LRNEECEVSSLYHRIIERIENVMAKTAKEYELEEQIKLLNEKYDALLERGAEFRVLREIKDRLKELKMQLSMNGNGSIVKDRNQNL